eukprot:4460683-Pyramimonas_sp.AAC.2
MELRALESIHERTHRKWEKAFKCLSHSRSHEYEDRSQRRASRHSVDKPHYPPASVAEDVLNTKLPCLVPNWSMNDDDLQCSICLVS